MIVSEQVYDPSIKKTGFATFDNIRSKIIYNDSLVQLISNYYNFNALARDIKELYNVREKITFENRSSFKSDIYQQLKLTEVKERTEFWDDVNLGKHVPGNDFVSEQQIEELRLSLVDLFNSEKFRRMINQKSRSESFVNFYCRYMYDKANILITTIEDEITTNK